jgi:hypothetical protein
VEFFFRPEVALFSGVLAVVALLAVLEMLSTFTIGSGPASFLDALVDTAAWPDSALTNWLLVKEVPLMVALTTALTGFGATGLLLQGFAIQMTDRPLAVELAVVLGLAGAVFGMRGLNALFRQMKVTHTTALEPADFIGRRVVLLSPVARKGQPGEAKFTDQHGQTHYLMVQPDGDADEFVEGDHVTLCEVSSSGYFAQRSGG